MLSARNGFEVGTHAGARIRVALVLAAGLVALLAGSGQASAAVAVDAESLRADVSTNPWGLRLLDAEGGEVLAEAAETSGEPGRLGFRAGGTWHHATQVTSQGGSGGTYTATLATTDPGRTIALRLERAGEGTIALDAQVQGPGPQVQALGMGFGERPGESYLGFGERSNAVDQRGNVVENYVADGPYQPNEYPAIELFVPDWGLRARDDSTYYPVPWLLSTAGYGVLVDSPETSYFHLDRAGSWWVELVNAPPGEAVPPSAPPPERLSLRFFAGPSPAKVLQRFTRETGRQPAPAAPWQFGPWVQPTGNLDSQLEILDRLTAADAPLSVGQTYRHYLPCGDQVGNREAEQQRASAYHDRGVAITTYFNPMVCTSYTGPYQQAEAGGGLVEDLSGDPYVYQYSAGTPFDVSQFDFTRPAGRDAFGSVVDEAIADGHDGWMEDFGEYTPLDSRTADGVPGTVLHNVYPRQYHCAASEKAGGAPRPIIRFQRSGWAGTAPCAQVVWGGDPTTGWGFDGLESSVRQALTMGLSGISNWGSDIGGFFALGDHHLTPELLTRWVQFGAVSGVMRTQANGIDIPEKVRPQVWDPDQIDNWRRYTNLRTQLYPYLVAADALYRRKGIPLMRHLSLVDPDDPRAAAQDTVFGVGPDLLAAPVVQPGANRRALYLPRGRWVNFWRALTVRPKTGALGLRRAKVMKGRRDVNVKAPLDELPMFIRAGALLPLMSAKVDTLTNYGAPGSVARGLRHFGNQIEIFAFPRGRSSAKMFEDGRLVSREKKRAWTLRIKGDERRNYTVRASLRTLRKPFKPCEVKLNGRKLRRTDWSFSRRAKVLTVTKVAKRVKLHLPRRCK